MWHFPNRHLPSSSMPGSSVTSRACPPMIPASGAEPIAILDRTPGDDGPGLPQAGAVTAATRVGVEPGVSRAEPTTSLAVAGAQAIAISVVVPTFNEADNVGTLVERLEEALAGRRFEVLIVDDDSPDLTWQRVETLARTRPWLGCYRRIGTRGLSSAVIDGLVRVTGSALVVIDADLQHDPALVPLLAAQLDQAEVAVASRYTAGGETCGWSWMRLALSRGATLMARLVLGAPTSDPMSGCFAVRRSLIERIAQDLQPRGYKILMEILYRGGVRRVAEVPYRFGLRLHGDSKLTGSIAWDFLASMWDLRFGAVLPVRFLKYCVVGASGVGIQLMVTHLLRHGVQLRARQCLGLRRGAPSLGSAVAGGIRQLRPGVHCGGGDQLVGHHRHPPCHRHAHERLLRPNGGHRRRHAVELRPQHPHHLEIADLRW